MLSPKYLLWMCIYGVLGAQLGKLPRIAWLEDSWLGSWLNPWTSSTTE